MTFRRWRFSFLGVGMPFESDDLGALGVRMTLEGGGLVFLVLECLLKVTIYIFWSIIRWMLNHDRLEEEKQINASQKKYHE